MVAVVLCLSMAMILGFAAIVLSAMASSEAKKSNTRDAERYAMFSAVSSGVVVVFTAIALIIYVQQVCPVVVATAPRLSPSRY